MDREALRAYKREWARRYRAAHPEKRTVAGGRPSRAKKLKTPGQCTACGNIFPLTTEFFVLLKDKVKKWSGLSAECRACRNARFRAFYKANRKTQIARSIAFIQDNPAAKAAKNNRDMIRYMRRKKLYGCPPWADQVEIEKRYAVADLLTRLTGIPHEVDHYFPLCGKNSCGLHVPWNLCVITAAANQAKGNRSPTYSLT